MPPTAAQQLEEEPDEHSPVGTASKYSQEYAAQSDDLPSQLLSYTNPDFAKREPGIAARLLAQRSDQV